MAYTVRNLCNAAAREIGYIDASDQLEGEDADVALELVQGMVDLNQGDRRLLYAVKRITQALISNQQAYTIGTSGGTWTGDRPFWISTPMITPAGDTNEIPLHLYTRAEWLAEQLKTLTDLYPQKVLYEPSLPTLGTFTFWPIPTSAPTFAYGLPQPLTTPASFNTDLAFAPGGYQELARFQLALRMCRPFKRATLRAEIEEDIEKVIGIIARNNDEGPPAAKTDPALRGYVGGGYDIRSNQYR